MKIWFNKICGMMQKQWLEGKHGIEHLKKKKRTKINFLSFYLRKLEETEQGEKKKERIKYKQKATELRQETGGKKKSMKPKAGSLKR